MDGRQTESETDSPTDRDTETWKHKETDIQTQRQTARGERFRHNKKYTEKLKQMNGETGNEREMQPAEEDFTNY